MLNIKFFDKTSFILIIENRNLVHLRIIKCVKIKSHIIKYKPIFKNDLFYNNLLFIKTVGPYFRIKIKNKPIKMINGFLFEKIIVI